jgi:hypothetical protein
VFFGFFEKIENQSQPCQLERDLFLTPQKGGGGQRGRGVHFLFFME